MTVRQHRRGDKTPDSGASYGQLRLPHTPKEDTDVLPPPCARMDQDPDPLAALEQTASHRLGLVEPGDGAGLLPVLTAVSAFLATWLGRKEPAVYQQLREFCYEATAKRGPLAKSWWSRRALCRCWAGSWRSGGHAVGPGPDATTLGTRFTVLAISVVLSGLCHPGGVDRPGRHGQTCLAAGVAAHAAPGAPGGPTDLTVLVLADRGLYARWLFRRITRLGWHPFLAHQYGRDVAAYGSGAWGTLADLGA